MKIAVFGYYNALNAGDDRIQYCITRLLKGNIVVFLPHFLPIPQEYLQDFDWILIGGGGLVFERVGIWVNTKQWIRKCKAQIGVIGLGVNKVSSDLVVEISHLVENTKFFYVRDEQSKALLNNHPKVKVHPDLTWCFPLEKETNVLSNAKIAVNLVPCHWKDFNVEMWIKQLSGLDLNPFPLNFNTNRDYDLLKTYFGDEISQEFTLTPLRESSLLLACRFHAIIFAMQIGKLFIAINYDEKVYRLLAEADLLDLCLETTSYDLVLEKIEWVRANQLEIQEKINSFVALQQERAVYLKQDIEMHLSHTPKPSLVARVSLFIKSNIKKILFP